MKTFVYYVGTPEEVAHHAEPLAEALDVRIVSSDEAIRFARSGDLCIFFNEYYPRFRRAILELKARQCATLFAIDGILEWRNSWELPQQTDGCRSALRPVLSHKVACIGRSQARVLESWGNLGKCEVVGVPRFDALRGRHARHRLARDPFRVLIMTAKCPGFTGEQISRTTRSLRDLNKWFQQNQQVENVVLEPVWRLTRGLEQQLGVANQCADTTGTDLAAVLQTVDAVITTPSTSMLEGMLHGLPVALLDYHNRPHYVPAAWRVSAREHLDFVIPEMLAAAAPQMLYQQSILHDALECHTPATPRMVELADQMQQIARFCLRHDEPLAFPSRMIPDVQEGHHLPEPGFDASRLFIGEQEGWLRPKPVRSRRKQRFAGAIARRCVAGIRRSLVTLAAAGLTLVARN